MKEEEHDIEMDCSYSSRTNANEIVDSISNLGSTETSAPAICNQNLIDSALDIPSVLSEEIIPSPLRLSKRLGEHEKTFRVIVCKQGPLLVRLKMHTLYNFPVVHGFDKDFEGNPGEVECDGRVGAGDAFLAINGLSLECKGSLKEITHIIKSAAEVNSTRELVFLKKNYVHGIASNFSKLRRPPSQMNSIPINGSINNHSSYSERYDQFLSILSEPVINLMKLRDVSCQGIPDDTDHHTASSLSTQSSNPKTGLRPLTWRILLRYLPCDKNQWPRHLDSHRKMYHELEQEMSHTRTTHFTGPSNRKHASKTSPSSDNMSDGMNVLGGGGLENSDNSAILSTLSSEGQTSDEISPNTPNGDGNDAVLLEEIEKDVVRTYPELHFFVENEGYHQKALLRILFLYAKLNTGVRYVQGMNEIVGTMYYVLANDGNEQWRVHAEADTFFCFSLLMSEIQDLFIRTMDETNSGIRGRIYEFMSVLELHDPELVEIMRAQGLDPAFYTLRWMTTLMSREFDLPDTIRLWDGLFADSNRHEIMCYLCCAMVIEQREALLLGDFADNLRLLQTYPPTSVTFLYDKAIELREIDRERRRAVDPLKMIQQELQVGREIFGAAVAAATIRTEQVTDTAVNVWMPAINSAVTKFVNSASANVKKIVSDLPQISEGNSSPVVSSRNKQFYDERVVLERSVGDL